MKPLRVLFMGTPDFAADSLSALISAGHEIVLVVTRPDAPSGRGLKAHASPVKRLAQAAGLPLVQPPRVKDEAFSRQAGSCGADVVVVVAYGRILPAPLLAMPRLGAVNLHASLLPKWRGAAPISRAIANGDRETGVTTMRMIERLDAGDILMQRAAPIGEHETAGELERRLAQLGADLLVETLEKLSLGTLAARPQNEAEATYAPMLRKQEGAVDWSLPAPSIDCRIRAFDPWPGAFTTGAGPHGRRLTLWKARPVGQPEDRGDRDAVEVGRDDRMAVPGTVGERVALLEGLTGIRVACGGGTSLALLEVQPEGRRRMTVQEAISGRHIAIGDRLGQG
ncbi:MAG TPA: methionyl-tRNA formyltransferase [Candidatus Polarisedimenticolia bacterium]|nr:methionyl-tRNA formyltransferase [Candidatus Polarisedimenticolia bacterium]